MFNKTSAPPPRRPSETTPIEAPPVRRTNGPRAASLLGPDLVFEGQISGEGELHVEGGVRGDINVARLVVGEHAQIEGTVRGGQVEVRGRVVGNIEAKAVKLYETAHVEGDISHEQLSIDVGAFFQGRCQQFQRPAPQPAAQPAPQAAAPAPPPAAQPAPQPTAKVIELDKAQG
jgi:cytoskeletal protein CcmA (bactofilin family)